MATVAYRQSIRATNNRLEADYYVMDDGPPPATAVTYTDATAAGLAQATSDFGTAPIDFDLQQLEGDHSWVYKAMYAGDFAAPDPPEPGQTTTELEFSYQAQSYLLKNQIHGVGFKTPLAAPDFEFLVGVKNVNGVPVHEGLQVEVPPETVRVRYVVPNAALTTGFQDGLRAIFGHSNNAAWTPFWRSAAYGIGDILLTSVRGAPRTNLDWEFSLGFAELNPFEYEVDSNTYTVRGNEVLWTFDEEVHLQGTGDNRLIYTRPKYYYVDIAWPLGNLAALGI